MLNLNDVSHNYIARPITETELDEALALCKSNMEYYAFYDGKVSKENILSDMYALPPNVHKDKKIYAAFYHGGEMAAILDLILQYPNDETAHIGLFMTHAALQKRGVGTQLITGLLRVLKPLGFSRVRLGCIKENKKALSFWIKNGFTATGDEKLVDGNLICVMAKEI